ncbi:AraC family transcriptional regulator [Clostridium sp. AM58-1XD]|uniref:AraC family transcriptional regulator n=1 Tax=Clostridium sp. AM58-1XD TaxID=2292307 RepID=UPI000E484ADE|nr:AraC family transcriptional regulator [Clostridium sp. AM58-1XD]RGZ00692.1 AraC family transcriptional regulator [Clostridium sp. AM58-1XD]
MEQRPDEVQYEHIIPKQFFQFKLFPFRGKDGRNYRVRKHWHQWVEILLVMEGSLDFYIYSTNYHLQAKDYMIVNPNVIHSIHAPHPNKTIFLQIPLECFDGYLDDNRQIVFCKKEGPESDRLMELLEEMYHAYSESGEFYTLRVKSLFYSILYLMMTEFAAEEKDKGLVKQRYHLEQMSDIITYIEQHYTDDITLEGVAQEFNFSPSYLSRMFQKYARMNYKTYLLDLRSENGYRELVGTDHPISLIAVNQGFPNSKAFAKAFRKRYGCLPSEYRKSLKLNQ